MDRKKKVVAALLILFAAAGASRIEAQNVAAVEFCGRSYDYGVDRDTVSLYIGLRDGFGKRISDIDTYALENLFTVLEDGVEIGDYDIRKVLGGIRIPEDYTFSVVLDQTISQEGKRQIWLAIEKLMAMVPEGCVFLSFYGDGVSNSVELNSSTMDIIKAQYMEPSVSKTFYSAVYAKLSEFVYGESRYHEDIRSKVGYDPNPAICQRARMNPGKNCLMVFAEGSKRPDDEEIDFIKVTDFQKENAGESLPRVYAFFYTEEGDNLKIETTLKGISEPRDAQNEPIESLRGKYCPSSDMAGILAQFDDVANDVAYDYEFLYTATSGKRYAGNVSYEAKWGKSIVGSALYTIGSAERPWPERKQSTSNIIVEILVAILVTVLTFGFFFIIMKALVPWVRSLGFKKKYYRPYVPEANVQRRICHYCRQEILPGQIIVTKCNHWMHDHCWKENGYKCAEYGQNCKDGIQPHVVWKDIFKLSALREHTQALAGVVAGLVSWIIYEICGRGGFGSISESLTGMVLDSSEDSIIFNDCVTMTSSFLMIGLLLGIFTSLVFRYNDELRSKTWKTWMKIIGLSLLTGFIGMVAFAIGALILCLIASAGTYIPWYASLPAYVLFSICVSLAMTIKSTIPVKSALLGGCISAVIGFLVLYFTRFTGAAYDWLNMLLDFIIFGGGLGAALITVRMLAEKYFLVIQNGEMSGQRIPIHKWMNATGGGNKVSIGITGDCEIQMTWDKSNKVAKEHVQLYIDHDRDFPVIKPMASGVIYNGRAELPVNRTSVLSNGDIFQIGDTIFKYEEA